MRQEIKIQAQYLARSSTQRIKRDREWPVKLLIIEGREVRKVHSEEMWLQLNSPHDKKKVAIEDLGRNSSKTLSQKNPPNICRLKMFGF